MNDDFDMFIQGKMNQEDFLKLYGHLRPGTYDITSQRYDKNLGLLKNAGILNVLKSDEYGFYIENKMYNKIS